MPLATGIIIILTQVTDKNATTDEYNYMINIAIYIITIPAGILLLTFVVILFVQYLREKCRRTTEIQLISKNVLVYDCEAPILSQTCWRCGNDPTKATDNCTMCHGSGVRSCKPTMEKKITSYSNIEGVMGYSRGTVATVSTIIDSCDKCSGTGIQKCPCEKIFSLRGRWCSDCGSSKMIKLGYTN